MSPSPTSTRGIRAGLIVGHVFGWLFVALGLVAWGVVLPITLRGFEGFGVEKGLVTMWIGAYGAAAGIGTVTLLGVMGWQRALSKIVLTAYLVLLLGVIIAAMLGAE